MPVSIESDTATPGKGRWFDTTNWTVVLSARDAASPRASEALERLCCTYWPALYAYLRREGKDEEAAKDLTQAFFERLLEKNYLAQVDRTKGKFRSFLLAALKHFLADAWDKAHALKRGGGRTLVSLDAAMAEDRYRREPADTTTPEDLFERGWAAALLEQVRTRLREEYAAAGQGMLYYTLRVLETGGQRLTYAQVAKRLEMTEGAVKSAVLRMRRRFAKLLREEIAHTVASPAEIDEEIRYILGVLSG